MKGQGRAAEANRVFTTAEQVARAVRLDDLLRGAEAEFRQPVGDTGAATPLPSAIPAAPANAPPANRDSAGKPAAKPAVKKPPAKKP
jgi:hypothetical protein